MGADFSTLDKHGVAAALAAVGDAYKPYCEASLKNGIDGDTALDLDDEDLQEYGVASRAHRKALLKKLKKLGQAPPDALPKYIVGMEHGGARAFWASYSEGKATMPWSQFVDFFAMEFMKGQPDMTAAQHNALKESIDGVGGDGAITSRKFDRWARTNELGERWSAPAASAEQEELARARAVQKQMQQERAAVAAAQERRAPRR